MSFSAKKYKSARLSVGLSQAALAEKMNITQSAVSAWENGRAKPTEGALKKLDKIFGFNQSQANKKNDNASEMPQGAFGAWLKTQRIKANISVPELASGANISAVAIYNIEAGKSLNPREETKTALAAALNIDLPDEVQEKSEEDQEIQDLGSLKDFDPYSATDLPAEPGVYVFYDVSDRPIYVGKSYNIKKRVGEHSDKFWFKFPIVSHASYVKIENEILRHQVEQILIKFLKSNAVVNKQSVEK